MRPLTARVTATITRWRLLDPGDRVAVAVSGGPDSVALAWLMRDLAPECGAALAGLIHVNHQLRGVESDADEGFCRDLAARLGVPIDVATRDVARLARTQRISIESTARLARYEAFASGAARLGATRVATGHTEDDQAETVILRLLRGAGTRGLSGIRIRRDRIIRPLLEVRRADLKQYLRAIDEPWREDASNEDRSILRNRVRHELVPVLLDIAPGGVRALARLARYAADDEEFLEQTANEKRGSLVVSDSDPVEGPVVSAAGLGSLPPALARRLVRQFAARVVPRANLSAEHLEAVYRLASTDKRDGQLDLPDLSVRKSAGMLQFRPAAISRPSVGTPWPERTLEVPGVVELPEAGVILEASVGAEALAVEAPDAARVVMPRSLAAQALRVRNRRPGDRLQPLGSPGRRKLQDLLVDRKVPRAERDAVPIVTDGQGEILWVAGIAVAERCRLRSPAEGVLLLELRKHQ